MTFYLETFLLVFRPKRSQICEEHRPLIATLVALSFRFLSDSRSNSSFLFDFPAPFPSNPCPLPSSFFGCSSSSKIESQMSCFSASGRLILDSTPSLRPPFPSTFCLRPSSLADTYFFSQKWKLSDPIWWRWIRLEKSERSPMNWICERTDNEFFACVCVCVGALGRIQPNVLMKAKLSRLPKGYIHLDSWLDCSR